MQIKHTIKINCFLRPCSITKTFCAPIAKNVMAVANGPGTKIYPGQLKKALDLLAKGKAIDYEGATAVKFTDVGEHVGNFLEKEIKGGKFKTKKQR